MRRTLAFALALCALLDAPRLHAEPADSTAHARTPERCPSWSPARAARNPTERELRCHFAVQGPGRFGLLSYADVPVYQPATPMPGTHVVGIPGHAGPRPGESYEEWEWRVLRTSFGPEARRVHTTLDVLDPRVAGRILELEQRLREAGVRAARRETWRSPERQAYLFQQGRSRPGGLVTTTLTSWHSQLDEKGRPAGRAVDYDVPAGQMERFHRIVEQARLSSFGADSNDPGHVFVPEEQALSGTELAVLRLLSRVPNVTLATGRPVDEPRPAPRALLREESLRFAQEPFIPFPRTAVAGMPRLPALLTAPLAAAPPQQPAQPAAGGRSRGALAERR